MKPIILMITTVFLFVTGCSEPAPSQNPEWVDQLIEEFQSAPVGNPPQSIWRYEYDGQVVYFIPAQCCDMFSTLYDTDGSVVCAPNGGLDGRGDGRCADFVAQRTQEQLVWQDPRTR